MIEQQHTGRKLQRNHSNASPRYIIAYDCQTHREQIDVSGFSYAHVFRVASAQVTRIVDDKPCGTKSHRFDTVDGFWQFVRSYTKPNYTTWLVAHNALDKMVVSELPAEFERGELTIDWPRSKRTREDNVEDNAHARTLCIIDSPPTIIAVKVSSTQGRLVIVDAMNWFPVSMEQLALAVGESTIGQHTDHDTYKQALSRSERNSRVLLKAFTELVAWVKSNDFGMFRYTAPAQAMSAFRHRFMKHDIYCHDNMDVKHIERCAYFGGRTEVFKIGEIPHKVYQLDVNSLFPSVMAHEQFPYMLDRYELRDGYSGVHPVIDWSRSIAFVELCTDDPLFPVRKDKAVIYPKGLFRTALCGPELDYAKRMGFIYNVGSWAEYKTAPLFTLWVDELWHLRQSYKASGNLLYNEFAKRLMNSLYGKFGQLSPSWVNVPDTMSALPWTRWVEHDATTGERVEFRSFGWQIQRHSERTEIAGTFVAIAAFVTSAARMKMNYLRELCGEREVYYQGVDGLIVTQLGYDRLNEAGVIRENEIGKLRLQLAVEDAEIYACADYRLGDKVVVSGRAREQIAQESGETLQRKYSATNFMFSGRAIAEIMEYHQPWERQGKFTKGTIGEDGWIEPLTMGPTL